MFAVNYLLKTSSNSDFYINKAIRYEELSANVLVKHCISLFRILKHNKQYQNLLKERIVYSKKSKLSSVDKTQIAKLNKELKLIRDSIGLSEYNLQKFAKLQQYKYKNYIYSQQMQVIASNIWVGVQKILFDEGEKLHYKRRGYYNTLSAKSKTNGIKFDNEFIYIGKLKLKFIAKDYDHYSQFALQNRTIKFARLIRKQFNSGYRYYIQFVFDGTPYLKHSKGIGTCGIDPGVSSVAVSTDTNCMLEDLAPHIKDYNKKIIKYQKQLEQSQRVNNPTCYNSDGTIIKGSKFKRTKNYYKILRKLKTSYRKRTSYIEETHSKLCNQIIEYSDAIYYEEMNFKALQKRAKTLSKQTKLSVVTNKNGKQTQVYKYKKKKRFGKTLNNKSPSAFITRLIYKCEFYDIPMQAIKTTEFRASQYNHMTDSYNKKKLIDRWNSFTYNNQEIQIQRDLYSSYLIQNTNSSLDKSDRNKCIQNFNNFIENHNKCIKEVKENNLFRLSCFGF